MFKLFLLSMSFVILTSSAMLAQSTNTAAAKDPKAELREKINYAHEMTNMYLYMYSRDTGTDRHYRAYLYWLAQRQDLVKKLGAH
jgi:hypothetical protein